ncbi:hypothetical protein LCGC14_0181840 [marine sediment metagenome]|uniref:Uroporphyrinogen decarboxylase (URO-D) domain-containing protein n=1 Tax=marine sediment metagenome TaxID=412755 RepID=A0A0F9UPP3_9ZZZZ|nr:hypothetical protein [Phycisphaerae bacterium]HDZ42542.1 hypothetical protein [Phycisphaerae bacterium]
MAIDFARDRWEKIREDAATWWAGELDRPLIPMDATGRDPGRDKPKSPAVDMYDLSIPAADIIDHWDYNLCGKEFWGDGFPYTWLNLGPGVLATFVGGRAEPTEQTVWFYPDEVRELPDLHIEYDPDSWVLRRIKDIARAAMERWEGQVLVGMTDLGGTLDVLSTFRPSEKLLLDLVDHPDDVKRVTWEIHDAWFRAFDDINAALGPLSPGHAAWVPIYSRPTSYMLQCDFAYMIGPEMFDEFVKPEFAATCKRVANAFYHLDGVGQLPHLDSMLEIEELDGIQWVPGTGQKGQIEWPEVYAKVRDAGKLLQIYDWGGDVLNTIADQLGSAKGIVNVAHSSLDQRDEAMEFLKRYGVV